MVGLPDGEKNYEDIFIRFERMYERDRHIIASRGKAVNFWRAMLCINAVYVVSRCLSVRLSVTFVYCVKPVNIFSKFLTVG